MFPECNEPKNRRLTSQEMETEKWIAGLFKRPLRHFSVRQAFFIRMYPM